jgi:hypothetical protein
MRVEGLVWIGIHNEDHSFAESTVFPSIIPTPNHIYFSAPFHQTNIKQTTATMKFLFFAATLLAVLQPISARWCKHYILYCGQYLLDSKGKQQDPPQTSFP